ncbi:hypothetical protein ACQKIE_16055 [Luteibacter sp. NPDC031894]|uniref:hypothetical protein n=1 Tax=Luteibacter sp. NPDC031894 TaxID=3390572 RepID=UPI003D044126
MKIVQPSFTGGEISPSLYARVDLQRYANSLKTCRNWIVSSYGGVYNRHGHRFVSRTKWSGASASRLIPFQFSIDQNYVVELGDRYARFYANGALVMNGASPAEIPTPWSAAEIWDVSYSQSADVMYLTHVSHPPRVVTRTSANTFSIDLYDAAEGPFQPVNPDESKKMASSGVSGNVTITCNANVFTSDMVGMFVYLENKNLSAIKPWTSGEKGIGVGAYRRNAGKTYQVTQVSTGGSYLLTGGNAPTHDEGTQWDGPGDVRNDGTNTYSVGVAWTYIDSGYGIAKITAYNSPTSVNALVTKQMPLNVVGGVGSPGGSWTLTGDGSTVTFPIAGNVSNNTSLYAVTIGGTPTQSNPNYQPQPTGPVSNCVAVDMHMPGGFLAGEADGRMVLCIDHADLKATVHMAKVFNIAYEPCWRAESESGAWLVFSKATRCETRERGYVLGDELEGLSLPCGGDDGVVAWEQIVSVTDAGTHLVAKIDTGDHNYLAGGEPGRYISTHNMIAVKD